MTQPAIDTAWLESTLLKLLNTPTGVPAGQTEVQPGDPLIIKAIADVVRSVIESLGPAEIRPHPAGDIAARFGPAGDEGILVQTYVVSQHGNLMNDPSAARIVDGAELGLAGPTAVGQGANQNKEPMAAVLAAIKALPTSLMKPVWVAVKTEGKSSHGGSRRILDDLGVRARYGVVTIGTDLRVSVGNRGRVDVVISVAGESCHSSQPWSGSNPIEVASDLVAALRQSPSPEAHPKLGPATAAPYQLANFPVAPHTIPAESRLVVDRRLLPGESVSDAVDGIAAHLAATVDGKFSVDEGEVMLPAEIATDAPVVEALLAAVQPARRSSEAFWSLNTFGAGYACSQGIPSCMLGPGRRSFGSGVTAAESVALSDCEIAASALLTAFDSVCA